MSGVRGPRPAPPLLPGARRPSPWLILAVLVISLLAGVELAAATVAARTAHAWLGRLGGSITVAVAGRGLESADAAAARAAEILALTPGVVGVRILDPAPGDGLAATAMGLGAGDDRGGTPRLLAAAFAPGHGAARPAVADLLSRQGVAAAADVHDTLDSPLERLAFGGAGVAAALPLTLIAGLWWLTAWAATRAGRRLSSRLDLLSRLGAAESQLAPPLAGGATTAVLVGAVLGTGAALALAAGALWLPAAGAWLAGRDVPTLVADGWDLAPVALWPALAVLIGFLAARSGARRVLRTLP